MTMDSFNISIREALRGLHSGMANMAGVCVCVRLIDVGNGDADNLGNCHSRLQ